MAGYEIRVRGLVTPAYAIEVLDQAHVRHESVVTGPLDDEHGLLDVLDRLYALGLQVLDAQIVPAADRPMPAGS